MLRLKDFIYLVLGVSLYITDIMSGADVTLDPDGGLEVMQDFACSLLSVYWFLV